MDELFQIKITSLPKNAQVIRAPFDLTILRERQYSVSVDRLPLIEYYVFFNDPVKEQQVKVKVYKTLEGKWYDKFLSEEAELHSPEFGIQQINDEVKAAIDMHEVQPEKVKANNFL
jgi:hypothetical protein